jgi:hypothetical protein
MGNSQKRVTNEEARNLMGNDRGTYHDFVVEEANEMIAQTDAIDSAIKCDLLVSI